ncbi:MAG: hypothetical protein E7644_04950 [Ruminococcaceae bacterium]|nr:hypothetical protein [Oscillospiraceae bacterium]
MKKTLSLLLCLCLLVGAVVLLTSCNKPKPVDIDLGGYKLIYDDAFSAPFKSQLSAFTAAMRAKTGATFKFSSSGSSNVTDSEILVGVTSREESATLQAEIEGDGYAIGVVNNKLVIVGTTPLLTLQALQLFTDTYLTGDAGTGTAFSIEKAVVSNVEMVTLYDSYIITYSERYDDVPNPDPENPNKQDMDYPVVAAKSLRDHLKEAIKLKSTSFNVSDDSLDTNKYEILVGHVNRDASRNFAKTLDADQFGIKLDGTKLVVLGLNDTTLRSAAELFGAVVTASVVTEGNQKIIRIPSNFCWTMTLQNNWVMDFPRPDGVDIAGSVDVGEGSLEFYYKGPTATVAAYEQYCEKLKGEGYTVLTENTIEDSIFRTFVNTKKKITLHVTYAAYSHAFAENIDLFEPCIRIVSASTKDLGNEIDESLLKPDYSYTKLTDTTLTGVRFAYDTGAWGNSYVVQLEDGSFFVQDGGAVVGKDYNRLYNVLRDLFYRSHGINPTVNNPIVVAGWYLSHGHGDHYGNFVKMCENNPSVLRVEYLFTNMPSDDESYNVGDPNLTVRRNMKTILNTVTGGTTYIKMHSGHVYHLRNMEIQVMYTHEDIYPWPLEIFNDSSSVLRTVIHNTDGKGNVQGEETSILWLGDLNYRGSKCVIAMYGDYLKADIVQLAHHGYNGCEYALYENAAPSIVLWPNKLSSFQAQTQNPNSSSKNYRIDYQVAHVLESVEYIVVLDQYNTTITITKDGPDMSIGGDTGLYNAYEHDRAPITTYGGAIIKK